MEFRIISWRKYWDILLTLVVFLGLYVTHLYHYLLFHSLVEFFSIAIGCGLFLVAWNVRQFLRNNYFLCIGVAYLFVAGLDLIHMLAYEDMDVLHGFGANLPTQLWIAARYIQSISLLVAPLYIERKLKPGILFGFCSVAFALLLIAIFRHDGFPACYVEGIGPTAFKIVSEYVICLILMGALALTLAHKKDFDSGVLRLVVGSLVLSIGSEICFILYVDVFGFANFMGHYFKVVAFYLMYRAMIETGLREPYTLLFRELEADKQALLKDEAFLREIGHIAKVGGWELDLDPLNFRWTEETYRIHEVPLDYRPSLEEELLFFHEEDRPLLEQSIQRAIDDGEPFDLELRFITAKGKRLWTHTIGTPCSENGKTVRLTGVFQDITERKLMEKSLRESQQRLLLSLTGANLGIWEWDLTTGKALWDERSLSVLGYEQNEFEPNLKNWKRIVHPEDWPRVSGNLNLHLQGKLPKFEVDFRIRNRSGEWQWALARGNVIAVDDDGNPTRMAGVFADATERKEAEEALRKSEAKYRFLTEHASDLLWTLDLNLRTTFVSPSVERVLGFTPEERMLQAAEEQLTPESLQSARTTLLEELLLEKEQGIQEGRSVMVELDYWHKNGSIVCLQTAVTFIRDEKGIPVGLHGISRDITQLKRAQDAVRESEEKYRTVVEESFDGVFVQKGPVITFGNARLHEMLGYERGELEGLDHWLIYDPEYQDIVRSRAQARLRGESVTSRYEVSLLRKDGTSFPAEVNAKVIQFDNEPGIQVWIRDLTEQKLLEKRLVQAQKMEAIGTLTGGIAHDFNNLLTVIIGYAELIVSEKTEDDPTCADLQKILETGSKGAELVQRLLSFGQQAESNPRLLDLNRLIANSVDLMQRTFPKMVEIVTSLADDVGMVNADASQIEQALMNLCINAQEAMPQGGRLRIETSGTFLDQDYCRMRPGTRPGGHVVVAISDTGKGMSKEIKDRIFDPFFTTKGWDANKGTGLGLSVAKGIVEQNRGWITCKSEPGKGTTFKLYFPATRAMSTTEKPEPLEETVAGTQQILLVDDEDHVRDLGKRILERAGHKVITATNGKEALEIYGREQSRIGMVILDLVMPEMGGETCLEGLLAMNPAVKVVISTGHYQAQEDPDSPVRSAIGFVNKPYKIKELLAVVNEGLAAP